MDWINDALTLHFYTTKADQTGKSTSKMKRLYANPFSPEICVVLDLAFFNFCKHRTGDNDAVFFLLGRIRIKVLLTTDHNSS